MESQQCKLFETGLFDQPNHQFLFSPNLSNRNFDDEILYQIPRLDGGISKLDLSQQPNEVNCYKEAEAGDVWKIKESTFKSYPGPNFIDSLHDVCSLDFNHSVHLFEESGVNTLLQYEKVNKEDNKPPADCQKPSYKSTCNSEKQVLNGTKLIDYINDVIENGMKVQKVRAGRPKQEFDTSYDSIKSYYEYYACSLQNIIEKNYSVKRSDTFRNTIFSYLKKLPIKLRERSWSVSEPKSKKMSIFLDAFLTPFVSWFQNHFDVAYDGYSKVELFLYFMCISYPEDKWLQILDKIYQEDSLSQNRYIKIKATLKARKGKSKKDITNFIKLNPWFQIYCNYILRQLDSSNFDEQAKLMIQDFLLTNES